MNTSIPTGWWRLVGAIVGGSTMVLGSSRLSDDRWQFWPLCLGVVVGASTVGRPWIGLAGGLGGLVGIAATQHGDSSHQWSSAVNAIFWCAASVGSLYVWPRWPLRATKHLAMEATFWARGLGGLLRVARANGVAGFARAGARGGRAVLASMTRGSTGPSLLQSRAASVLLREGETLVLALSAILYALARYSSEQFYGEFGVTPEEAGVSTTSLVFSSGVAALALSAVALLLEIVGRRAVRHVFLRLPLFVLGAAAIAYFLPLQRLFDAVLGQADPRFRCAVGGAVGAFAWFESRDQEMGLARRTWGYLAAACGLPLVVLIALAVVLSHSSVGTVRAGDSVSPRLGPFMIAGIQAPTVRVWPLPGKRFPRGLAAGACVHRFGAADDLTVLYDAGQIWRLATQGLIAQAATCESHG
jgi:hypothetical protein